MMSLIIDGLIALGTIAVAILAIWGDWARSLLAAPKLTVRLRDSEGELTSRNDGLTVRYYHLTVANERKWSPAKRVLVFITGIEVPGPDGSWQPTMPSGPIPLSWQFIGGFPRDIGLPSFCDLGRIVKAAQGVVTQEFGLTVQFQPNNFVGRITDAGGRMRVHVKAVGDNAESATKIIEIAWDGQWEDGTKEMGQHFKIREVH